MVNDYHLKVCILINVDDLCSSGSNELLGMTKILVTYFTFNQIPRVYTYKGIGLIPRLSM